MEIVRFYILIVHVHFDTIVSSQISCFVHVAVKCAVRFMYLNNTTCFVNNKKKTICYQRYTLVNWKALYEFSDPRQVNVS